MKSNKAFTLIELLVVISIIGVISSIVFVSFSGSRDKARLAKMQSFDAQISHALGAYAVGVWRFEEGAGINIHDESGFGNDGTFSGNLTPVFPEGVYSGTTALQFDGSDDYINCGNGSSLNITDAITVEAWVKADTQIIWDVILMKTTSTSWNDGYGMYLSSTDVIFWVSHWSDNSVWKALNADDGNWHHIVGTYDKNAGQVRIFVDGAEGTQDSFSGDITTTSHVLEIGRGNSNSYNLDGQIDNVAIYDEALTAAQIQQHYAAGTITHGIALND